MHSALALLSVDGGQSRMLLAQGSKKNVGRKINPCRRGHFWFQRNLIAPIPLLSVG